MTPVRIGLKIATVRPYPRNARSTAEVTSVFATPGFGPEDVERAEGCRHRGWRRRGVEDVRPCAIAQQRYAIAHASYVPSGRPERFRQRAHQNVRTDIGLQHTGRVRFVADE